MHRTPQHYFTRPPKRTAFPSTARYPAIWQQQRTQQAQDQVSYFSKVPRMELVHHDSVMMLTTRITATARMLSVLANTPVASTHVAPLLAVLPQPCRIISLLRTSRATIAPVIPAPVISAHAAKGAIIKPDPSNNIRYIPMAANDIQVQISQAVRVLTGRHDERWSLHRTADCKEAQPPSSKVRVADITNAQVTISREPRLEITRFHSTDTARFGCLAWQMQQKKAVCQAL